MPHRFIQQNMFARLTICLLTASLLTGCGGSSESWTPEEIGAQTVTALKANNFDAYFKMCVTKDDILDTLDQVVESGKVHPQDMDDINEAKANIDKSYVEYEREVKEDFDEMVDEIDWAVVTITKIETEDDDGDMVEEVEVLIKLSNKRVLRINKVSKTANGWKIADKRPLHLRQAGAEPLFELPRDMVEPSATEKAK